MLQIQSKTKRGYIYNIVADWTSNNIKNKKNI